MVLACLAGTATKEVLATAPLLVLLYDRTFVVGRFGGVAAAPPLVSGLAAIWLLLLYLVAGSAAHPVARPDSASA